MDAQKLGAALSGNVVDRRGVDTMTPLALQMLRSRSGYPAPINQQGSTGTAAQNSPMVNGPTNTPAGATISDLILAELGMLDTPAQTPAQSVSVPVLAPQPSFLERLMNGLRPSPAAGMGLEPKFRKE